MAAIYMLSIFQDFAKKNKIYFKCYEYKFFVCILGHFNILYYS